MANSGGTDQVVGLRDELSVESADNTPNIGGPHRPTDSGAHSTFLARVGHIGGLNQISGFRN